MSYVFRLKKLFIDLLIHDYRLPAAQNYSVFIQLNSNIIKQYYLMKI